ncbi:Ral-GDS-related protein [Manis javanica]|nr:Ral-GDS-related protein [Manis javanica]
MCAGLYSRVDYSECKAYVESQPLMKGIELLAPNVQMVIRQFDAMVSLVISSCLGTLNMTARDRAQVVEFWIQVAKECLALKNFAALRAILVGLRSRAIRHLESTWRRVSWKSSRIYKKLQKRDEKNNREWLLKEAGAVVKQQLCAPNRSQDRKKQGMVPFLGLFLRDVPVDQLPEYNEDGDRTRVRQLNAMSEKVTTLQLEIMLHKHVAGLYDLEPEERFVSFFQAVEPLDEEESYSLSCQLESRGQEAGREGVLPPYGWCNMLTYWPGPAAVIGPSPLLASWLHAEQSHFPFRPAAPGAPRP